jgi:hypothetical protein
MKKAAANREHWQEKQRADSEKTTTQKEKDKKAYICHCSGKKEHILQIAPRKTRSRGRIGMSIRPW